MANLQYRISISVRERGDFLVELFANNTLVDRYTTRDLSQLRRNAAWSKEVVNLATAPWGVAIVAEPTPAHQQAWIDYVMQENARS